MLIEIRKAQGDSYCIKYQGNGRPYHFVATNIKRLLDIVEALTSGFIPRS